MLNLSGLKKAGDWLFQFFITAVVLAIFAAGILGFFRFTIDDICNAMDHEEKARAEQVQERVAANSMAHFMSSE